MVRRGLITAEEAEVHPRRNEILRSVGVEGEVEIDVAQVVAAPGDFFILCSDGLTGLVSDLEIAQIVQSETPENAAKQLVDLANERGGHDNVTVQIARVPSDPTQTIHLDETIQQDETKAVSYRWIAGLTAAFIVLIVTYLTVSGDSPEPDATIPGAAPVENIESLVPQPEAGGEELTP
jgi:hypothetical protein